MAGGNCVYLCISGSIAGDPWYLAESQERRDKKPKKAARQSYELNQKLKESHHELETALMHAESANSAKTTFFE